MDLSEHLSPGAPPIWRARADRSGVVRREACGDLCTSGVRRVVRAPPLRAFVSLLGGEKGMWVAHGGALREFRQLATLDDRSDVAVLTLAGLTPPPRPVGDYAAALGGAATVVDAVFALWGLVVALIAVLAARAPAWLAPVPRRLSRWATLAPRSFVVTRTWRVDDDGAFFLRLEPGAPPGDERVAGVRARLGAKIDRRFKTLRNPACSEPWPASLKS